MVAYSSGNYYFRHFSDGELNNYDFLTFSSTGSTSASFDALYQYVPPSQAATLNVIAEYQNGTVIGNTVSNTGYVERSPGLWVTVTPPGAYEPFTGSYTGGTLLPFVLIAGDTYTAQMSSYSDLKFVRWSDTGSTNATRTLTLDQNTTLIAIFEVGNGSPATAPSGFYSGALAMVPLALILLEGRASAPPERSISSP